MEKTVVKPKPEAEVSVLTGFKSLDVMLNVLDKMPIEDLGMGVYGILVESREILNNLDVELVNSFWKSLFRIFMSKININRRQFISEKELYDTWLLYLDSVRTPGADKRRKTEIIFWKLMTEYLRRYSIDTKLGMHYKVEMQMIEEDMNANVIFLGTEGVFNYYKTEKTQENGITFFQAHKNYVINDSLLDKETWKGEESNVIRSLWRQEGDYIVFENFYNVPFVERGGNWYLNGIDNVEPIVRVWRFDYDLKELALVNSEKGRPLSSHLFRDYFPIADNNLLHFYFDPQLSALKCKHSQQSKEEVFKIDKKHEHLFKRGRTFLSPASDIAWIQHDMVNIFARYKMEKSVSTNTLVWVFAMEESLGFNHTTFDVKTNSYNFTAMDAMILTFNLDTLKFRSFILSELIEDYVKSSDLDFYKQSTQYMRNLKVMNYDVTLEDIGPYSTRILLKTVEGLGTVPFSLWLALSRDNISLSSIKFLEFAPLRTWWFSDITSRPLDRNFVPDNMVSEVGQYAGPEVTGLSGLVKRIMAASQLCLSFDRDKQDVAFYSINYNNVRACNMSFTELKFYQMTGDKVSAIFQGDNKDKTSIRYFNTNINDEEILWQYSSLDRLVNAIQASEYFMPRSTEDISMRSGTPLFFLQTLPNSRLLRKSLIPGVDSCIQKQGLVYAAMLQDPIGLMVDEDIEDYGILHYDAMGMVTRGGNLNSIIRYVETFTDDETNYLNHNGKNWANEMSWWLEFPNSSSDDVSKFINKRYSRGLVLDDLTVMFFGRYIVTLSAPRDTYYILHDLSRMRPSGTYYENQYLLSKQCK